jgi:hypothetical protein
VQRLADCYVCSPAFAGERQDVTQPHYSTLKCSAAEPTAPRWPLKLNVSRAFPRVSISPELVPLVAVPTVTQRRCSRSIALLPVSPSGSAENRSSAQLSVPLFPADFQRCLTRHSTRRTPPCLAPPSVPRRGRHSDTAHARSAAPRALLRCSWRSRVNAVRYPDQVLPSGRAAPRT